MGAEYISAPLFFSDTHSYFDLKRMFMHTDTPLLGLTTALFLSLSLAACGSGEKAKTQVAARVNGEEVTVYQLNQALGMMGPTGAADAAEASKNALESIINETIGVQAAVKAKLDRDPAVVQAIDSARRRILLEAYLQRNLPKTAGAAGSEAHEYYSQHPELFANRRIYIFNQLTAKAGKESVASLTTKVAGVKQLSELVAWLKEKGVDYSLASDVKPAEQLPMMMLAAFQKLKIGDIGYLSAPDGVMVIELAQAIERPLTEQQAQPLIERFLANQKQMAAAQKMLQDLRANAKVEYRGEFEHNAKPEQPAQPQSTAQPSPATPEKAPAAKPGAGYMEKGLKGL